MAAGPRVAFVHRNFPAQFGQIAGALVRDFGWDCTFVNERAEGVAEGVKLVRYAPAGGASSRTLLHARNFENAAARAEGVHRLFETRPDLRPDVIVGHSGFGSTALLPELFDVPIVGYFEYWYRARGAECDFRPDFPAAPEERRRARLRNAMILMDLEACVAGYSPTAWQTSLFPAAYRSKIETVHDGIDTVFWSRARQTGPRRVLGREVPDGARVITYVARGFESLRGFDVFARAARRILEAREDVIVVAVGEDRVCYGGDDAHTGGRSFLTWVRERVPLDPARFLVPGRLAPDALASLLAVSDLHVYLTAPFVLSWSLLNAMSCECVVLASDTAPVREFIVDGVNGLLTGFFDDGALAARALHVLADPARFRPLGMEARRTIIRRASLAESVPKLARLFETAAARGRP